MSDDRTDAVKPWTIKGIGPEARNAATAAADRERQTLGEWITRAIRTQIQSDRQRERSPTVVGPTVRPEADRATDLTEIERIIALTASLASAGAPPPKAVSRAAYALLRDRLGTLKGQTKGSSGPTQTRLGPTGDDESPTNEAAGSTR